MRVLVKGLGYGLCLGVLLSFALLSGCGKTTPRPSGESGTEEASGEEKPAGPELAPPTTSLPEGESTAGEQPATTPPATPAEEPSAGTEGPPPAGAGQQEPAAETPVTEGPAIEAPTAQPPAIEPGTPEGAASEPSAATETVETPAPEPGSEEPAAAGEPSAEQPVPSETEAAEQLPKVPLGLPPVPIPEDNPMTAAKVELGRMLYFDTRLSKDGTISCATCHDPKQGWTEHDATSEGIGGQRGDRNSPTVINAAYATSQFWDGRAASLEEQALGPIENPIEMGHNLDELVKQLDAVEGYRERFQQVFGTGVTKEGIAKAIAAFERTVLSGNSAYDRFKTGQTDALSEEQKRGLAVFEDAGCATCHTPPLFSNYRFYNAGVGMDRDNPDLGRMKVTGKESDRGKFRVPSLRDAADTAPYFHDGSAETLEEAVALMAGGGKDNPNLSVMLEAIRRKNLSAEDQQALVQFIKALSGEYPVVEPPELP